jgi:hypothetical protein
MDATIIEATTLCILRQNNGTVEAASVLRIFEEEVRMNRTDKQPTEKKATNSVANGKSFVQGLRAVRYQVADQLKCSDAGQYHGAMHHAKENHQRKVYSNRPIHMQKIFCR